MSLIVGIRVAPDAFELGRVLAPVGYEHVTLETIVPAGERTIPLFWISDERRDDFVDAVRKDANVERFEELETVGGRTLYAIGWIDEPDHLIPIVRETDGYILRASGTEEAWEIEIRFEHAEDFPRFQELCEEADIPIEVHQKYNPSRPDSGPWFGLTDPQWEALALALDRGYFQIPRRCTVADLADEFDISDQAMSERLRRALGALVENTMAMSDRES